MWHLPQTSPFHRLPWRILSMQGFLQKYVAQLIVGVFVVCASFVFPTANVLSKPYRAKFLWWFRSRLSWRRLFSRDWVFESALAEQNYWRSATLYQARLRSSNARSTNAPTLGERSSMITYYSPSLLPMYRTKHPINKDATEYYLPARIFCKWHYMVFPGPVHPTIREAEKFIQNFSNRDRQEIYRISRLLTDEEVFDPAFDWNPTYRELWREWLATKGPDTVIVFTEGE